MADNELVRNSSQFPQLATKEDFGVKASSHFWQTAQTYQIVLDSCHESPNISHYLQKGKEKMEQKLCMSISWQGCSIGILSKENIID